MRFAASVARERGHVSDAAVRAVKDAGYSEAQVMEIVVRSSSTRRKPGGPPRCWMLWGEARVIHGDALRLADLMPKDRKVRDEQILEFRVLAWDANCPQHIPQRFDAAEVARLVELRDKRIAELEAEVVRLSFHPPSARKPGSAPAVRK